jgi:hypothetical protein
MKFTLLMLECLALSAAVPGEIDRVCRNGYCSTLTIEHGQVRLSDPLRTLSLGSYVESDQHLTPRTEAPIRDLASVSGWHVVLSAFLDHTRKSEAGLRIRFYDADGSLRSTADVLIALEQVTAGHLFGNADDIVAVTSSEEHAYNVQTDIWLLPRHGNPKSLLSAPGVYKRFWDGNGLHAPGVMISRETYDGLHADTKGTTLEFYIWDRRRRELSAQQ